MGLLCIRFFNPHNCYPRCRGDSEVKWLAKGYTVRRYPSDSKDLKSQATPGLSQQCWRQALGSLGPQRAPAQACRSYRGLRPPAPESTSLSLLFHLPGGDNATQQREERQHTARNQSTAYGKGNAPGPPATQMSRVWPAPSPGELCRLKQIKRRGWSTKTGRRGGQEVEKPGFCIGPVPGHRRELNRKHKPPTQVNYFSLLLVTRAISS